MQNDDDQTTEEMVHPVLQRGAVQVPASATPMTDADEEVFLLYTSLAARQAQDGLSSFRGLGHVDSHEDTLTISFTLKEPSQVPKGDEGGDISGAAGNSSMAPRASRHSKRRAQVRKRDVNETLEVEILQDKTALRSRKGDTGSVVWRASVDFAEVVMQQLRNRSPDGLFAPQRLAQSHVLELGAGTGFLGVVLSPFVHRYTITDTEDLIPLIRKNVTRSLSSLQTSRHSPPKSPTPNIVTYALDWIQLYNAPASLRPGLVPPDPIDVILVVDCIYHPSLLSGLLATIDFLAIPNQTAVVVVVELRADDVIREFLQRWLDLPSSQGKWELWSVDELLDGPYAVWVGWKTCVIME